MSSNIKSDGAETFHTRFLSAREKLEANSWKQNNIIQIDDDMLFSWLRVVENHLNFGWVDREKECEG